MPVDRFYIYKHIHMNKAHMCKACKGVLYKNSVVKYYNIAEMMIIR